MSHSNIPHSRYLIAAFYVFEKCEHLLTLKAEIKQVCQQNEILGTILLAKEGINGTIAGLPNNIHHVIQALRQYTEFSSLTCKYSESEKHPFKKMKVAVKKEIVTLRIPDIDPAKRSGIKVSPENWNELISKPDILLIDTRNNYEIELGTFKNAINPNTNHFVEFPKFVQQQLDPNHNKKIAMFCTGGIRCEKASAYLLEQGFEEVYQLEGGILKYLEKIDSKDSLWEGKCFIFDNRGVIEKNSIKKNPYV